jgi:hypothetical protein
VKILQDVLRQESFTDYASLLEAVKTRCGKLHIRDYEPLVHQAIREQERGGRRSLLTPPPVPPRGREPLPTGPVVTARDAKAILAQLGAHIRIMPDANR